MFKYLILSCLVLIACERDLPSDLPEDAGPAPSDARVPGDAGAVSDAGPISRPGAGPLDPDEAIDCVYDTVLEYIDAQGVVSTRYHVGTARWPGTDVPPETAWTCVQNLAPAVLGCPAPSCRVVGAALPEYRCLRTIWFVDPQGQHFVPCFGDSERDVDDDGDLVPNPNGRQHVAVVY